MCITFGPYPIAVLLIDLTACFSTRDLGDCILGGHSLDLFVTAVSAGASDMSGWLLMGLPGVIYLSGLNEAWIVIGLVVGACSDWLLVVSRLRVHIEYANNALMLPDYFLHRFGTDRHLVEVISVIIILFLFMIHCASGIAVSTTLFQSLFHGMSYNQAMRLGTGTAIAYTSLGGLSTVSWADTLQVSLMIFVPILVPVMVYLNSGGIDQMNAAIQHVVASMGKRYGSLFAGMIVIGIVSTAAWGLGYLGQPHALARSMAVESAKSPAFAYRIGMTQMVLCLAGAAVVGYFDIAYFGANSEQVLSMDGNHERISTTLSILLFNPRTMGITLSTILVAVMPILSCQLLARSGVTTEDFYKDFLRKHTEQKELVWTGCVMVPMVTVIAIPATADLESKVLGLVSYAWAGLGAAFGLAVIFPVLWKCITVYGVFLDMIAGALTTVAWAGWVKKPTLAVYGTGSLVPYEIAPGFIICALVTALVSLINKVPSSVITERSEEADAEYKVAK